MASPRRQIVRRILGRCAAFAADRGNETSPRPRIADGRVGAKKPNPNLQTPRKFQAPISKDSAAACLSWSLDFGDSLGVGNWGLVFSRPLGARTGRQNQLAMPPQITQPG